MNALLDKASTKTYITGNADVAAELGLKGWSRKVTVNILNGQTETSKTMPVKVELESLDGSVKTAIKAFTAKRVTGNMNAINWGVYIEKADSPEGPEGHTISRSRTTAFCGHMYSSESITLSYIYSFKDVGGISGEPVARLMPLGWTCVGPSSGLKGSDLQTNHSHILTLLGNIGKTQMRLVFYFAVSGRLKLLGRLKTLKI